MGCAYKKEVSKPFNSFFLYERAIYKVGPRGDSLEKVMNNHDYNMIKELNQIFDSGKMSIANIIVFPYWGGVRRGHCYCI